MHIVLFNIKKLVFLMHNYCTTCDIFMAKVLLYCIQHKLCYNNVSIVYVQVLR